jgi:hypothetical protein
MNEGKWIDTPGLKTLLDYAVPQFGEILKNSDLYTPILVMGPTGSGKSHIANRITRCAGIPDDQVIHVNCAAIPENLIESELFGYEKGAFTGAAKEKPGLLDAKGKVIIILDEIGTLPKYVQAKLLTFLDTGEYRPVGSNKTKTSAMKVLGITNANGAKSFREDFFYRFRWINVPGLHMRRTDILVFLKHLAPNVLWTGWDLLSLLAYNWPGNTRQLAHFAIMAQRHHKELNAHPITIFELSESDAFSFWCQNDDKFQSVPDFKLSGFLWHSLEESQLLTAVKAFYPLLCPANFVEAVEKVNLAELSDHQHNQKFALNLLKNPTERRKYISGWKMEWEGFCSLFGQNPVMDQDLLLRIVDQKPLDFDPNEVGPEVNKEWFALRKTIWKELDLQPDDRTKRRIDSSSVTSQSPNKEQISLDLPEALALVCEQITPLQYRSKWVEHCLNKDLGPAKAGRKYSMNAKTLGQWFREYKKAKGL